MNDWMGHDLEKRKKRKNSNGYLEVFYPEHPYNVDNWVLLHRLVMEDHIGRHLEPDEVVHHLNEIKTCNEIWNLFLTDEKEHTLIHRMGKRHKKSSTANMSKAHKKIVHRRVRGADGRFIKGLKDK